MELYYPDLRVGYLVMALKYSLEVNNIEDQSAILLNGIDNIHLRLIKKLKIHENCLYL